MKLLKMCLIILLCITLIGCSKSSDEMKIDLEEEGWNVTIITKENINQLTQYLGSGLMKIKVKSVIWGMKSLKMGFVLEFENHSDAKDYYNDLMENERTDVYRRGKFVIISDSAEFIKIVE